MIISILGYPFSGKSTIAEHLSKVLGVYKVSTGDIMRSIKVTSDDIDEFKSHDLSLKHDDFITEKVISEVKHHFNIILDGFPRSRKQCQALEDVAGQSVIVFWIWSNPVYILDRVQSMDRDRSDDCAAVIKGRIEAAADYKQILRQECDKHGWLLEQHTLDNERMSDIITAISRFALRGCEVK